MSTEVEEVVLPNEEAEPEEPVQEEPSSEEKLSEEKTSSQGKPSFGREKPPSFGGEKPPSFGEEKPPSFGEEKLPSFGEEKPPSFDLEKRKPSSQDKSSFGQEKPFGEVVDSPVKDPKRSSFSNQPPNGPRMSFSKDPSPFPLKSPSSKANFRPQPGIRITNKPSMQRQLGQTLKRAGRYLPDCRRGDAWMYAAVYVAFYTLLMLFRMSTFGFICIIVYTILFTLLVLKYFGHGPLVGLGSTSRSPRR